MWKMVQNMFIVSIIDKVLLSLTLQLRARHVASCGKKLSETLQNYDVKNQINDSD